ncbi:RNA-binding protein 48 [Cucurbita argyrosperma subsp. argyrosperma]|nr:RNA-binding protein 48 [Cucurbita argyrosperma subsp. argyrosperma]
MPILRIFNTSYAYIFSFCLISYSDRCKPMDAEECDEFTDVYFVKFHLVSNARFAKRKLDEFVFLGNRLQVSYAPDFESLLDTKEKLEVRRREVLARLDSGRPRGSAVNSATTKFTNPSHSHYTLEQKNSLEKRNYGDAALSSNPHVSQITRVSSDQVCYHNKISKNNQFETERKEYCGRAAYLDAE